MEKKKNGFASGIGFVLAAAGSAVGLGNLWAFPFKTSANGGAAFLFVYIACVLFIGAIAMVAEIYIGKRVAANAVTAYKSVSKGFGWMGLLVILIPFLITCYYSILGGYTLKYTLNSFAGNAGILPTFSVNVGEVILYTALIMVLTMVIVMAGVKDGIEKASKVLMPILFLILVFIVIFCLCLGEGVGAGLNKYLNPDFYAFFHNAEGSLSFDGLLAAMGQAFFSLSLGMGAMICYGSYTGKEIKIGKSVAMICIFDTCVAFLAGLAIFPAIGALAPENLNTEGGIGLMFNILPLVFDQMGGAGQIISFLFFGMVSIAAVTSIISLVEVVTQFVVQKTKMPRKKIACFIMAATFVLSIPIGISLGRVGILEEAGISLFGFDLLTFLDEATNAVLMPLGAFAACFAIGWLFGEKKSLADWFSPRALVARLEKDGLSLGKFAMPFAVMVKYVTPILILFLDIAGIVTNVAASAAYWAVVGLALLLALISIVIYFSLLKNSYTGCNADEAAIEAAKEDAE